jgi:hypothetical protein
VNHPYAPPSAPLEHPPAEAALRWRQGQVARSVGGWLAWGVLGMAAISGVWALGCGLGALFTTRNPGDYLVMGLIAQVAAAIQLAAGQHMLRRRRLAPLLALLSLAPSLCLCGVAAVPLGILLAMFGISAEGRSVYGAEAERLREHLGEPKPSSPLGERLGLALVPPGLLLALGAMVQWLVSE